MWITHALPPEIEELPKMKFDLSYREARDLYRTVRTMRMQMKRRDYAGDFIQRVEDLEGRLYFALDYMETVADKREQQPIGESHPKAAVPEGGHVDLPANVVGRPPLED